MPNIVIVDYQLGNLFSVRRVCELLGCPATISSDPRMIAGCDALILPGVGAFGQAMENLRQLDLVGPLRDHAAAAKPFFGICLGLQLLFEGSEEFGSPEGLSILRGSVKKLPVLDAPVPQIGWNRIEPGPAYPDGWQGTPLENLPPSSWMYFVHSFYVANTDEKDCLSCTDYAGFGYTSAVLKGSIFATQYHPEKSSKQGLKIYRRWIHSLSAP
jgi:glutamine amidotransferase